MKKFLGISLLIAAAILSTAVFISYRKDTFNTSINEQKTKTPKIQRNFTWGVTSGPYQLDGYKARSADEQIKLLKNLNVNAVRLGLERTITLEPFQINYDYQTNDDYINRLVDNDLDVVLILDGDIIGSSKKNGFDFEKEGYNLGSYAAKRYKDKVQYYQIANEVTGTIIKPSDPNFSGETIDGEYGLKYSVERYNATLGWLKGMQKGIRENDPQAKIVLSGHWILHDIIKRLKDDGINFDILGWAWYSSDGTDITKREKDGGEFNLLAKLKEFGKPIWIIESNRDKGSYSTDTKDVGERQQAEFFENFCKNMLETKQISGFFAFPLQDTPEGIAGTSQENAHWGLVTARMDGNQIQYTKKRAFYTLQDIIKKNSF